MHNSHELRIALVIATVLPLALIAWAILGPRKGWLISALLLESILLVNAAWHILVAIVRHGYAPGVVTALLVNLPFGVYVLRRAVKEQWIGARTRKLSINDDTVFDPAAFLARAGLGRKILSLKKNEAAYAQGDPADAIFYVQKGRLKVTVTSEHGKEATIGLVGAGEFLGRT